jgi:hypothetical protein
LTAAHAAENRLVPTQDAWVTATLLQNVGPTIAALHGTQNAVIRAGALLIVKAAGSVTVAQLTPAQQMLLNHQPDLAQSPHKILAALRQVGPIQEGGETLRAGEGPAGPPAVLP